MWGGSDGCISRNCSRCLFKLNSPLCGNNMQIQQMHTGSREDPSVCDILLFPYACRSANCEELRAGPLAKVLGSAVRRFDGVRAIVAKESIQ